MVGQLKKLFYNKQFIDSSSGHIARWKLSPAKIFILFLALAILSVIIYAYVFTSDPQGTLGSAMFYAIIILLAVIALWLVGNKAWSLKNRIAYFLLTFIILWVVYYAMSLVFGYLGLKFYMGGYALWIIISILSFLGSGSYLWDNEINRKDFIYFGIVVIIFLGSNLTMNSTGGFLANFDKLLTDVLQFLKI